MAKEDVVAMELAAIQQGAVEVVKAGLGACYDQGMVDGKAMVPGGFTQADIDAAVKAAVDPLNAQIAADADALKKAQDDAAAALGDLQKKLDVVDAKEQAEEKVVATLQASVEQVQSALDAIKALVVGAK